MKQFLSLWAICAFSSFLTLGIEHLAHAQTRLDFRTQMKRQPSVVLLQRSVCSETIPAPLASNCTGLELYSLSFSDGSTRILIGIPDDGTISKNTKWNVVPITVTASGTGVNLGQVK